MAFNINNIRSTLSSYDGVHRPSHFLVKIFPPTWLAQRQVTKDLQFLCEATSLPGRQLDVISVRPIGYGTPENRPVDTTFAPIRCDFFVDNTDEVLTFFKEWMANINNANVDIRKTSRHTNLKYYEFAYPKDYEGTVEIYLFDSSGEEVKKVILDQAFPINIGDVSLAWEINDSISRVPITFSYNLWHEEDEGGSSYEEVNLLSQDIRNRLEAAAPGTPVNLSPSNPRGPR